MPVYDGAAALSRCLASLAKWPAAPVVVVDDASTDAAIPPMLERFARERPGTRLVRRATNGGFVAAANAGAAAAQPGRDLLFLNADTEVTAGALDEMAAALGAVPGAAVCCPLSNNATFLSVPRYQQDAVLPPGVTPEDMARLLATQPSVAVVRGLPTAVGFCMWVRRGQWDRHGPFDAAFGRGYGEDDELAQRIRAQGGEIVAAPRAFVSHVGRASFGAAGAGASPQRRANAALLSGRWPAYRHEMSVFCRANPLRSLHEWLWHRLLSWPHERPLHVLHVVSAWPGPAALAASILEAAAASRGFANHTIAVPLPDRGEWLDAIDGPAEPGLRFAGVITNPRSMPGFIARSAARLVHVHGDWPAIDCSAIARAAGMAVLDRAADVAGWLPAYEAAARATAPRAAER